MGKNTEDGQALFGSPAFDAGKAKRAYKILQDLPGMRKKIRKIEKQLAKSQDSKNLKESEPKQ